MSACLSTPNSPTAKEPRSKEPRYGAGEHGWEHDWELGPARLGVGDWELEVDTPR